MPWKKDRPSTPEVIENVTSSVIIQRKDKFAALSCTKKFTFPQALGGNQIHDLPYSGLSGCSKNSHAMRAETLTFTAVEFHRNVEPR